MMSKLLSFDSIGGRGYKQKEEHAPRPTPGMEAIPVAGARHTQEEQ